MRNSILLCLVLAGGCTATGSARYSAEVTTPRLVYVSDDVQVIEDYDQPVFFSASMYWRYDNGVWYQSRYHTRGWVRISTPPPQIVRIERPQAYVHYRARAQATGTHQDASPSPARPEVQREMKEEKREQKEAQREEKQEEKREMKEEKREQKQEAKQEKQEAKQEAKDDKRPR
jgi:flagellar biosynthesis GTPase FlhF